MVSMPNLSHLRGGYGVNRACTRLRNREKSMISLTGVTGHSCESMIYVRSTAYSFMSSLPCCNSEQIEWS